MPIVALANEKGGVGKTTTAANVAACLADLGQSVLLVDLDRQSNLTAWMLPERPEQDTAEIYSDKAPIADYIVETPWGVDLVPSSPNLISLEADPDTVTTALSGLKRYQWALLDCPADLGALTLSALMAARWLVVPVEPHTMALEGVATLAETVEVVGRRSRVRLGAIVPCRVTRTRLARECVEALRKQFGPLVTETVVRENIRLAESPSWHQPIIKYAPDSNGALDYASVTGELVRKLR